MVITCSSLVDEALSEHCRAQGVYPHHVKQWKVDFVTDGTNKEKKSLFPDIKKLRQDNKILQKELDRKDKALAETAALLVLKKSKHDLGKRKGQLTMRSERIEIIKLINQTCDAGARQAMACDIVGISAKTFQRWTRSIDGQDGRSKAKHEPKNKLTPLERQRIIDVANGSEFEHLPPSQIVPRLADKGE